MYVSLLFNSCFLRIAKPDKDLRRLLEALCYLNRPAWDILYAIYPLICPLSRIITIRGINCEHNLYSESSSQHFHKSAKCLSKLSVAAKCLCKLSVCCKNLVIFSAEKLSRLLIWKWCVTLSQRKNKIKVQTRDSFLVSDCLFTLSEIYQARYLSVLWWKHL